MSLLLWETYANIAAYVKTLETLPLASYLIASDFTFEVSIYFVLDSYILRKGRYFIPLVFTSNFPPLFVEVFVCPLYILGTVIKYQLFMLCEFLVLYSVIMSFVSVPMALLCCYGYYSFCYTYIYLYIHTHLHIHVCAHIHSYIHSYI